MPGLLFSLLFNYLNNEDLLKLSLQDTHVYSHWVCLLCAQKLLLVFVLFSKLIFVELKRIYKEYFLNISVFNTQMGMFEFMKVCFPFSLGKFDFRTFLRVIFTCYELDLYSTAMNEFRKNKEDPVFSIYRYIFEILIA